MRAITSYTQAVPGVPGMTFFDIGWLEHAIRRSQRLEDEDMKNGECMLHERAREGDTAMCKRLIKPGYYNVNARDDYGHTPLFSAIQGNSVECCKILIDAGANVDAEDYNKNTPLIKAVSLGYIDCVRVLLESGADVNKKTKWGETPLFFAQCEKKVAIAKLLMDFGGVSECITGDKLF
jgi:ankyrin repeat protein